MEDEINEYEKQLAEVTIAKKSANEEEKAELELVEKELSELLTDLQRRLPKELKPVNKFSKQKTRRLSVPELTSKTHSIKPIEPLSKTHTHKTNSSEKIAKLSPSEPPTQSVVIDHLERGKSNWQKFSRSGRVQKGRKSTN